ncbi:uncharacterized protein EI90DRAFT_3069878 [Cantharellus anzutake]|uniref:uncharacterized protein n=1 Tax=Cantharellus anzutake TaxID=1750568 RepID=UPI001904C0B1|nr:uncharacterized protein EI90DRAFT_3069878 [Cantharellus anzutake]KAF8326597.1 hypothetical protein EI90DRAFT_3069878 [Cantharellus anzutake]
MPTLFSRSNDTYAPLMSQEAPSNPYNASSSVASNPATLSTLGHGGSPIAAVIIALVEIIIIIILTFALAKWCLNRPVLARRNQAAEASKKARISVQRIDVPKIEIVLPEPVHIATEKDLEIDGNLSPILSNLGSTLNKGTKGNAPRKAEGNP